ncbi:DUF6051 family protein [Carboxylicivirga linearis]|uniref:Alpha/beta hydrolase n=1 Tax=Carboxylicivirga linearis TaxID=1628157 RepID=A0ABS5JPW2_9BACT|nr:DUF6051 family protein [Carboxylicivirga linearis]MBS2096900.1 hypothetical protein [Carboxylicivirga linearis]
MNYSYLYQTLKAQYSSGAATHSPDERALGISFEEFHSHTYGYSVDYGFNSNFDIEQWEHNPNNDFSYPVINPNKKNAKADSCIVMLHGLNERSWDKYLPWAYTLAVYTGKPVILFPIAYHMNRAPKEWRDPRVMNPFVKERKSNDPLISQASVVNVALSSRLTSRPERFLLSGYQAANDLMELTAVIQSGNHPLFQSNTNIDLFTYSIGTFLTQILMLAHGDEYFSNTRIFNFCGGSTFADMHGTSKYILDSAAFNKLQYFYNNQISNEVKNNSYLYDVLNHTALGEAFKSMLSMNGLRKVKDKYLSSIKDRFTSVVLKKDTVMRPENVKESLAGTDVEEWDFNFNYSHVTPFPLLTNKLVTQVNEAFDKLMVKAALLFTI